MGINVTCDCCQFHTDKVTEVGYVGKAYYCDNCLPHYNDYVQQVNNFHDDIARQAAEGLAEIKSNWLKQHGGTLPE